MSNNGNNKIWKCGKYVFKFGKHKGRQLGAVAATHPYYVQWCLHNIKGFEVDDKVKKTMIEASAPPSIKTNPFSNKY